MQEGCCDLSYFNFRSCTAKFYDDCGLYFQRELTSCSGCSEDCPDPQDCEESLIKYLAVGVSVLVLLICCCMCSVNKQNRRRRLLEEGEGSGDEDSSERSRQGTVVGQAIDDVNALAANQGGGRYDQEAMRRLLEG